MEIPIISGIYTNSGLDFRTAYPLNMQPVAAQTGISGYYLRPADGITKLCDGPGRDRGGINWNGRHIRVMGQLLCEISRDGQVSVLGSVGDGGQCSFAYSFDRLAITAGGHLWYWDGATLTQVTDVDAGNVIDHEWVDGYFLFTDGEYLIVTELNDPTAIDPLKYGSSEVDPDPVLGVLKLRNEPYALNRYTIEVFENAGGSGFPFSRINGAHITRGPVGTHAACVWNDAIAFVGSGRNEGISVYLGANAQSQKIATAEIDRILSEYTEAELSSCIVEARVDADANILLIHLPGQTLCYDSQATAGIGQPIWYILSSDGTYQGRNHVRAHDRWYVADPLSHAVGYLDATHSYHFEHIVNWEFSTPILYTEGRSGIIHRLELVGLTGRTALGTDPMIYTSYSHDGVTWSQERSARAGRIGDRDARMCWLQQGTIRRWRVQKFTGLSDARVSIARLEAEVEPLNV